MSIIIQITLRVIRKCPRDDGKWARNWEETESWVIWRIRWLGRCLGGGRWWLGAGLRFKWCCLACKWRAVEEFNLKLGLQAKEGSIKGRLIEFQYNIVWIGQTIEGDEPERKIRSLEWELVRRVLDC